MVAQVAPPGRAAPAPAVPPAPPPRAAAAAAAARAAAEARVDALLACVQPNAPSELRRLAVAAHVCALARAALAAPGRPVDAFLFGSVPLRAYLPDGDVDVTLVAPGAPPGLREAWAPALLRALQAEGRRPGAPFPVRDATVVQAEVRLVKAVVADVVVDVSFGAVGGLAAAAFLEWADRAAGRQHLFKRAVLLVKAWCFYEARILGAHHGLVSSYALEVMVLHLFVAHGAGLGTPLEALRRFLAVYAAWDWDAHALSALGPVPLASFPRPYVDRAASGGGGSGGGGAAAPLAAGLRAAVAEYGVHPDAAAAALDALLAPAGAPGAPPAPPVALPLKHLNIMDPLLPANNLGRSVSRASLARVRRALAYGSAALEALLAREPAEAAAGADAFFRNAWRAPPRMAADNLHFQAQLAAAAAPLAPLAPLAQLPRLGGPPFAPVGALPAGGWPARARRSLSSTALPELASAALRPPAPLAPASAPPPHPLAVMPPLPLAAPVAAAGPPPPAAAAPSPAPGGGLNQELSLSAWSHPASPAASPRAPGPLPPPLPPPPNGAAAPAPVDFLAADWEQLRANLAEARRWQPPEPAAALPAPEPAVEPMAEPAPAPRQQPEAAPAPAPAPPPAAVEPAAPSAAPPAEAAPRAEAGAPGSWAAVAVQGAAPPAAAAALAPLAAAPLPPNLQPLRPLVAPAAAAAAVPRPAPAAKPAWGRGGALFSPAAAPVAPGAAVAAVAPPPPALEPLAPPPPAAPAAPAPPARSSWSQVAGRPPAPAAAAPRGRSRGSSLAGSGAASPRGRSGGRAGSRRASPTGAPPPPRSADRSPSLGRAEDFPALGAGARAAGGRHRLAQ
jgi:hypothetical protein